jgi:hypothetical protein
MPTAGRPTTHVAVEDVASGANEIALRALPHGLAGTVGSVPFPAKPPSDAHSSSSALLALGAGVPAVAITAYGRAALILHGTDPRCHLQWYDVAGIGRVESDNGMTWGSKARVTPKGTLFPPIYGPLLDGQDGMPAIPTTDGGALEHDPRWARAVGPMQFLPSTWLAYAQDGNGDGFKDPQNFYDAALTTGVFLCANGGDLATAPGLGAAVLAYNHSSEYLSLVESWIRFYAAAGAVAVSSAGAGLLPTAEPRVGGGPTGGGAGHGTTPSGAAPAAALAAAAAASQSKGSYAVSMSLRWGSRAVTGTGAVNTRTGAANITLVLPGAGKLAVRVLAHATYVFFPPALRPRGTAAGWELWQPAVFEQLPPALGDGLVALADDLPWLLGQLEGATAAVAVVGHPAIDGGAGIEYGGPVDLVAAGRRLGAGSQLSNLAAVLAETQLPVTAVVASDGLVRTASLTLTGLAGAVGPTTVRLDFSGFGAAEQIVAPTVGGPPATTTTTTTAPSTTTTTSTSTTTTTTTSTSTTTTTTLPPTTSTIPS